MGQMAEMTQGKNSSQYLNIEKRLYSCCVRKVSQILG